MADLLQARDNLVQALINAVGSTELIEILEDFDLFPGGKKIVAAIAGPSTPDKTRWYQLIRELSKDPRWISNLARILETHIGLQSAWPQVKNCLTVYANLLQQRNQEKQPLLWSATLKSIKEAEDSRLRKALFTLASSHPDVGPDRLRDAIAHALGVTDSGVSVPQSYRALFVDGPPVNSWADFLSRVEHNDLVLDDRFLGALEKGLKRADTATSSAGGVVSSLMVMVLRPRNTITSKCEAFDFRVYFCRDQDEPPDQWERIDDRLRQPPISSDNWSSDLQALLIPAIRYARSRVPHTIPLLLEFFLPTEKLNADIGDLVRIPLLEDKVVPLHKQYRLVLRSSARFQIFQEGNVQDGRPQEGEDYRHLTNPLPAKWETIQSKRNGSGSGCYWWHDSTPASRRHSSKTEDAISASFGRLAGRSEFIGLKRFANLPSCPILLKQWLDELVLACPAVALWWRPQPRCSQKQRLESLLFSCRESGPNPFGSSEPCDQDQQTDPFTHPAASDPLKLFFSLASTVFLGQFEEKHAAAFRGLVLLVDSADRWPPPVDHAPGKSEPGSDGGVLSVSVEDIHMSC
jgi:hypothetical protein